MNLQAWAAEVEHTGLNHYAMGPAPQSNLKIMHRQVMNAQRTLKKIVYLFKSQIFILVTLFSVVVHNAQQMSRSTKKGYPTIC